MTHTRQVALDLERSRCVVQDDLVCEGRHVAEVCWHFSDLCDVHAEGDTVVAIANDHRLELRVTDPAEATLSLLRGQERPPAGWISRRYDEKVPSTTAIWSVPVKGRTRVTTVMEFTGPDGLSGG